MREHVIIRNKMRMIRVLTDDPFLSRYVPETAEYSRQAAEAMLGKYGMIYIKPNNGLQGRGIVRVEKRDDGLYGLASGSKDKQYGYEALMQELDRQLGGKNGYILQQGIHLATYQNRPFDVRFLLIKRLDMWRLAMTAAKVAAHPNAVVTNISHNHKFMPLAELQLPLKKVLLENDQQLRPLPLLRELIDLSYRIAGKLGDHFPFFLLGLDLAVDNRGEIWFIEANTNPADKPMDLVNNAKSYRLYAKARKRIKMVFPS